MALTKDQHKKEVERRQNIERIDSIIINAINGLYAKASQKHPGGGKSWKFYIHPYIREKLHEALLKRYKEGNSYQYHELARKPVLDSYMGIQIVEGYEYGIVVAHENSIFHPDNSLVFKDLFITHEEPA